MYHVTPSYTPDQIDQEIESVEQEIGTLSSQVDNILNLVYPVGSIYMSVSNTSPATLFGGTWEQLKDRFLLAAGDTYSAGTTSGSATKTIATENLPSHSHGLNSHKHSVGAHAHGLNSHTHGAGSYAVGKGGAHTHNLHAGGAKLVNGGDITTLFVYNASYNSIYAESAGSHSHTFSGSSGAAAEIPQTAPLSIPEQQVATPPVQAAALL